MPPFPPGSFNSPFGAPQVIDLSDWGGTFTLDHGAWYVCCDGGTEVVLLIFPWQPEAFANPARAPGTGLIYENPPPTTPFPPPAPWTVCVPPSQVPQIQPHECILVQPGMTGLVLADGQNVLVVGSGSATIIQAFSV